jgi:hypothetical protein
MDVQAATKEDTGTIYLQLGCETVNVGILTAGTYLMYIGIEINHPVYAVLFCNLSITLLFSFLNTVAISLLRNVLSISVSNAVNITSLLFHCCCWCVVSTLRYLFIIRKDWLEQTFPDQSRLRNLSILSVLTLFFSGASFMYAPVFYFGFPQTRVVHFPLYAKVVCLAVLSFDILSLIFASCYFYTLILRKRGKLGHSTVNVEERGPVSFTEASAQFTASGDVRITPVIIVQEELQQKKKEIESAIMSLKTNLIFILSLLFLFVCGTLFSSDFLFLVFTLFKGQSPVWITFFNFLKIQKLVSLTLEKLAFTLSQNKICIFNQCF